jgi:hypothetical protein
MYIYYSRLIIKIIVKLHKKKNEILILSSTTNLKYKIINKNIIKFYFEKIYLNNEQSIIF